MLGRKHFRCRHVWYEVCFPVTWFRVQSHCVKPWLRHVYGFYYDRRLRMINGKPVTAINGYSGGGAVAGFGQADGSDGDNDSSEPIKLKKELGLLHGCTFIIGIVVGSGIFVSPKGVLLEAGSPGLSVIVWTMCGMMALVGAMCYAELGTCIPDSGADYAYIKEIYGGLPAFLYLWVANVIIIPTGNAITAFTFASYILNPLFPDCGPPKIAVTVLGATCVAFIVFINCANVRWAARVQGIFTATKIFALLIVIVVGFYTLISGKSETWKRPFENTNKDIGHIALSFYAGLYSYSGWNFLNFVTEELKDPYKNLPRAIWISLPIITSVYVFANIAYFAVLTPLELKESEAVAVTFADKTLGVMAWIMPLFVSCSTFGGLNGAIFAGSRLCFVGARAKHFPEFLAMINIKYFTPMPALMFGGLMAVTYLCIGNIYKLINYMAFVEAIFFGITISGLLYLRKTKPNMKRPIKVHICFPIFYLCILIFLTVMSLTSNPRECFVGIIVVCTGIPIYCFGVMWKRKPKVIRNALSKITILIQKCTLAMPQQDHFE
ncbi:Y+L amino acid transporter 2 isoform X1 [Octopus bimaculoides]|uniref:Y+L amino acid transporter 2 isoform X1 n=2 Tax=Octopus bimaculoides TaxID=37653 RepID=UPI0022E3E338|nr:Y+L amino acid transporter 2 isoform X1 [Octopus bimaculoides]